MTNYWFFLSYARRNDISFTRLSERGDLPSSWYGACTKISSAEIINGADTGDATASNNSASSIRPASSPATPGTTRSPRR